MQYIDYAYYQTLYGENVIPEADFNRLSREACRKMDQMTTGVDGVRKLREAFPTDEEDTEAVRWCACTLTDILYKLKQAQESAAKASGYTETENGLQGKVITSISAGNESISFKTGSSEATIIEKAVSDKSVQEKLFADTITEYLSGVPDANGVNLLYRGRYPHRLKRKE